MSAGSYVRDLNNLDKEIKMSTDRLKMLREKKQKTKNNLYNYMKNYNLTEVQNGDKVITIEQCQPPKPRQKIKPKKIRIAEAVELFREVGIPDPEGFYKEFESTQKAKKEENSETTTKKRKGKNDYDDILGF